MTDLRKITSAYGTDAYADRRKVGSDWLIKGFVGDRRKQPDRRNQLGQHQNRYHVGGNHGNK